MNIVSFGGEPGPAFIGTGYREWSTASICELATFVRIALPSTQQTQFNAVFGASHPYKTVAIASTDVAADCNMLLLNQQ